MERLEAFEAMMKVVLEQTEAERMKMEELKMQGKEKSATYRQYMGNRLFYNCLIALYKEYGLMVHAILTQSFDLKILFYQNSDFWRA